MADAGEYKPGRYYKTKRAKAMAARGTHMPNSRRLEDGTPRPTTKLNVDPYYLSRLKARFISSPDVINLEELGDELAEYMGCDPARARNYVKMIAAGEGWRIRRKDYWERLHERALESRAAQTIETFETEMQVLGRRMVEKADAALLVLEPKDVTEAVLLLNLGQQTVYRSHRVPNRISRYLNVNDAATNASVERQLQEAPKEQYAAAVQSDLAALTAEVGSDPAAGGRQGRAPDR